MTDKRIRKTIKKGSPVIPMILSVVCAIALWMYVMSVESPVYTDTFYGVPVELRNETVLAQNSLSVLSGYGFTVDITVTGKRSLINQITAKDLVAYADLGTITGTGEYPLEIKTELIEGLSLNSISETTITVYADMTTSKTISVSSDITYYGGVTTGTGYSMGTPYIMPTTTMPDVTSTVIKGPVSILSAIDHARVSPIDLGTITSSVTYNSALQLVDSEGEVVTSQYITMINSAVTVYFPVVTEKEVPVEPSFSGAYNTDEYSVSVTPSKVTIRGEESLLKNIDKVVFKVDGGAADNVGSKKFDLTVDGFEITDGVESVTMTVKRNEQKTDGSTR